jgi:hypothetical protein
MGDEVADYLDATSEFSASFDWGSVSKLRGLNRGRTPQTPPCLVVCGLPGKVVGSLWLPLPSANLKLSKRLISRLSAELAERGLDPSYAQLILGEMLARSLHQK